MSAPGVGNTSLEPAIPGEDLSPISTYPVKAIAHASAADVYVVAVRNVGVLGRMLAKRSRTARGNVTSVLTSATDVLNPDPNRTGYILVNNGNDHIHVTVDGSAPTDANGIFLSGNGGILIVKLNDVYVTGPASTRPEPIDRNPIKRDEAVSVTAGAVVRARTTDWSYTVPASKKAEVEWLYGSCVNNSTISLNGAADVVIQYTPSGGVARTLFSVRLFINDIRVEDARIATSVLKMLAGDVIEGTSISDNSAAGTNVILASTFVATEFDA